MFHNSTHSGSSPARCFALIASLGVTGSSTCVAVAVIVTAAIASTVASELKIVGIARITLPVCAGAKVQQRWLAINQLHIGRVGLIGGVALNNGPIC